MLRVDLITFLLSAFCSLILTRSVRDLAITRGWTDTPGAGRHLHRQPVPRLGGIAVWLAFMIVVGVSAAVSKLLGLPALVPPRTMLGLLGPALIVFLVGLYDDLRELDPYSKFAIQSVAALLLYLGGFGIHRIDLFSSSQTLRMVIGLPLTVLWVALITNAFNLIDGLDGLAAGSALFSTLVVFVVSLLATNQAVSFLAVALTGAILGFLRFNFNPATIFLGDSGSLFIGFMLSALALAGSQKAPTMVAVAIPVVSFGLPIMDVVIAVVRRYLSGKPIFRADNDHIHHKLLKLGFSQRQAVFILYGISALLGLLSLAMLHGAQIITLVLVVLGAGIFVGAQQLRYHEFLEVGRVLERTINQKQIISNNLYIRRAVDSLSACSDVLTLCRILTETLQPLGFDGFGIRLPSTVWLPDVRHIPFAADAKGGFCCSWTDGHDAEPRWELNLELASSAGQRCGVFSVYRLSHKPLMMDVNLLSDGFQAALSGAVHRVVLQKYDGSQSQRSHQRHEVA